MVKERILIIDCGGTISCQSETVINTRYRRSPTGIKNLISSLTDLLPNITFDYKIEYAGISHDMGYKELIELRKVINNAILKEKYTGIILTVGTNALEEIAFFMGVTQIPDEKIIITGAMRPQNALDFDGMKNLYNAALIVSKGNPGVFVTFHDSIFNYFDCIKQSVTFKNAFVSRFGDAGYCSEKIIFLNSNDLGIQFDIDALSHSFLKIKTIMCELDATFTAKEREALAEYHGVISVGFGEGYQTKDYNSFFLELATQEKYIIRTSRAAKGIVSPDVKTDLNEYIIPGGIFTPSQAKILLLLSLSSGYNITAVKKIFQKNITVTERKKNENTVSSF